MRSLLIYMMASPWQRVAHPTSAVDQASWHSSWIWNGYGRGITSTPCSAASCLPCVPKLHQRHFAASDRMELFYSRIAGEEWKTLVSNSCVIRKLLEFLRLSSQTLYLSNSEMPCSGIGFYPAPGTMITLPNQPPASARWNRSLPYFYWSYF